MSAFGNDEKDAICDSIKDYIIERHKKYPSMNISEIVKEVMEAVTYGLEHGMYELENTL